MSRYAVFVGVVLLAASCSSVDQQQEAATLMERDRAWASSARNVDVFMTYFSTNPTIYPPGAPAVAGADAIRRMMSQMLAEPGRSISWIPVSASVSSSGDLGYTLGTYTSVASGSTERGKYVTIWRKRDGTWRVIEDIFNTDAPSPALQEPATAEDSRKAVKP